MTDTSGAYHEPIGRLSSDTMEMHRALLSLREELEAADWYRQRADACSDASLRRILLHNMREEIEHASTLLEWLRRNDADFDEKLTAYLFAKGNDVLEVEARQAETTVQARQAERRRSTVDAPDAARSVPAASLRLTIGSLKEAK